MIRRECHGFDPDVFFRLVGGEDVVRKVPDIEETQVAADFLGGPQNGKRMRFAQGHFLLCFGLFDFIHGSHGIKKGCEAEMAQCKKRLEARAACCDR